MSSMSNSEAVKRFIDQVQWLHEAEFGDFKRKVGLYLFRMKQDMGSLSREGDRLIEEIRINAVYVPSGDIEGTRRYVLDQAYKLLNSLSEGSRPSA